MRDRKTLHEYNIPPRIYYYGTSNNSKDPAMVQNAEPVPGPAFYCIRSCNSNNHNIKKSAKSLLEGAYHIMAPWHNNRGENIEKVLHMSNNVRRCSLQESIKHPNKKKIKVNNIVSPAFTCWFCPYFSPIVVSFDSSESSISFTLPTYYLSHHHHL